ncbi:MAG: hypothetical protein AB7F08_14520 [Dongiaceae bacterium]
MIGTIEPAQRLAGPARSLHGARRKIDRAALEPVAGDVEDTVRRNLAGEIPGADDIRRETRRRIARKRFDLGLGEGTAGEARRFQLAVVMARRRQPVAVAPNPVAPRLMGRHAERRAGLDPGHDPGRCGDTRAALVAGEGREGPLPQPHRAGAGIVARRHQIPVPGAQARTARDRLDPALAVAEPEREPPFAVDHEEEARALGRRPAADQALLALARQGRPDQRLEREARRRLHRRRGRDEDRRAGMDALAPPGMAAVGGAVDRLLAIAGAARTVVAGEDAHELRLIIPRLALEAHHDLQPVAGGHAVAIAIAGDLEEGWGGLQGAGVIRSAGRGR